MSNDCLEARLRHAPQKPPAQIRASNGMTEIRLGVFGNLSATSSPIARSERTTTAVVDPTKASGDPCKLSQPRCAAHATTAGGAKVRNPAAIPIPNAKARK